MISFTNVKIWDGVSAEIDAGIDSISFANGNIDTVGSRSDIDESSARDLGGLYLLPGLIDAHVHLCLDPSILDPNAQGKLSQEQQLVKMESRAVEMLEAGITTARDLGGGEWLELIIRDRILKGSLKGPRLICAGQPITSVKGHCHFWGGEAPDIQSAVEVLDRQVEHEVDLIKVMATGGRLTAGTRPEAAQFSTETLIEIVQQANRRGLDVAAHCHGVDGIRNAATAGVATIEHCSWAGQEGWGYAYDDAVVKTIVQQGIWVSPTINLGWRRHIGGGDYEQLLMSNFSKMSNAGVKLVASTDAGIPNVFHHQLPVALPVFAHFAGLTPVATLRSATSDGAKAIGLGTVTGQIRPGYAADFLILENNPLLDLAALSSPVEVFSLGVATLDAVR